MAEKREWHAPKLLSLNAALTAQSDTVLLTDDSTADDPVIMLADANGIPGGQGADSAS